MGELVYCEFLKLKRTKIKIIALLGICSPPILSMFSSIRSYIFNPEYRISLFTLEHPKVCVNLQTDVR